MDMLCFSCLAPIHSDDENGTICSECIIQEWLCEYVPLETKCPLCGRYSNLYFGVCRLCALLRELKPKPRKEWIRGVNLRQIKK